MDQVPPSLIHPTALVEPGAELGRNVRIGPFCHVGGMAKVGDDVELMSHVVIAGDTTIGEGTRVFPHAILGGEPQNTAYKGERTRLVIGRNNTIREGVTMHIGTGNARGETTVGDHCMFLAYSHVAHDSVLGDHVTFANNVMIGGHAVIGDRVIIGGGAAVHQFCEVGHHAFIGGVAAVVRDVIPYGMVMGNRSYLAGLNLVGMKRSGMDRSEMTAIRHAYKRLFDGGGSVRERAEELIEAYPNSAAVRDIATFILRDSKRHLVTPLSTRRSAHEAGDE
ncbi:acyl-ACP--UDP-N-acetylglucosamine O-acyltransferase [Oricola sp.]|uniref:acyl-ACP--UDP-N-acetylglucosamine O-acyltransferase n=1 Tax=Oricola sp. TaxID=1979950 RepID=UPI0025CCE947|nr:acyl-ACP--UDP-N-acetylglucosamine O-acyltransferase [Oricola sp.]MCI5076982.1 acyl-ACP--UDP-N-acetylglucosamine O-acyltransferase [Oricola sp.]